MKTTLASNIGRTSPFHVKKDVMKDVEKGNEKGVYCSPSLPNERNSPRPKTVTEN